MCFPGDGNVGVSVDKRIILTWALKYRVYVLHVNLSNLYEFTQCRVSQISTS